MAGNSSAARIPLLNLREYLRDGIHDFSHQKK